jgi:hypothetical protein
MRKFSCAVGLVSISSALLPSPSYSAGMSRELAGKRCRQELKPGLGDRGGSRGAVLIQGCIRDKMRGGK